MTKILTSPKEDKCIGCGLCIIKASLIENSSINLSKSFIRIYSEGKRNIISIDYGKKVDYKDIVNLCPQNCFEIKEI